MGDRKFGSDGHALFEGMLAGAASQFPIVDDVTLPKDADGIYETHFTVTLKSGIALKVTVEQVQGE